MPKPVTVTIDVPHEPERVFAFLNVMANHEPFNDHLMRDWELSGPARGVGSKARVHTRALGMSDVVDIEVIEAEAPTRIVERNVATRAGRTGQGTYTLAPLPTGGTRITFEYRWIVSPMVDRMTAPLARARTSAATTSRPCDAWPTNWRPSPRSAPDRPGMGVA